MKKFTPGLSISSRWSGKNMLKSFLLGAFLLFASFAVAQNSISSLSLNGSVNDVLTTVDLVATYTTGSSVVETASRWYKDGVSEHLLYLPFEAGASNALRDFSGHSNHVTLSTNPDRYPTWDATGGYNGSGAFTFDGNDFLLAGDIFPLNSSYTKTAWINLSAIAFTNIISSGVFEDDNHFFKVDDDGTLNAGHSFGTPEVQDAAVLELDRWYHVAVTFDYTSGEMILYRDGNEVDSKIVHDTLRSIADASVEVGSMSTSWGWQGSLDEVRIYDHVLTEAQIDALYSTGTDVIVAEETLGLEDWEVDIIPFSTTQVGSTYNSNTVTVHSINVTTIPDQTIDEGSTFSTFDLDNYVVDYEYSDSELTWTAIESSELTVSINPSTHVATVTIPDENWFGTADITFRARNPKTDSDSELATFTVNSLNDPPIISEIGDQNTDEDITLERTVTFSDSDVGDSHTITVVSDESNVTVANLSGNISGSTYDLVPAANWHGTAEITVTVTDDGFGTRFDVETYTLTVNSINDAPVLSTTEDQAIDEDNSLLGSTVTFTDSDTPDTHVITVVSDDTNVTVANLSGNDSGSTYDLVPAANWNGSAEITVTVTDDGTGPESDSYTYTLTVNAINDSPVLTDVGDQSTTEDVNVTGLAVVFTDPDDTDSHTITVVSSDADVTMGNLSGNVSGSTYDLEMASNWNGTAQITVRVTDNGTGALSDFETYTLTASEVNDPPVIAEIGDQFVEEGDALKKIPVNFNDPEASDTHVITVVSSESSVIVANLSGNVSGSTYALVPVADWTGTAQITVTVTELNAGGLFDTEIYTLSVTNVNDAPESISISSSTVDERVVLGTTVGLFSTVDPDPDDTHQYEFVLDGGTYDVDNDAFTIVGDTLKTNVELDFEAKSTYSILVQSDDGNGGTLSQNFTINVADIDETSVEDIYNNPVFKVYPVPAIDHVTVEVDNPDNKELLLELYSSTGRLVHAESIYSKSKIDLTGFSDGMYILTISGEQVYGTRKILVKDR